MFNELEVHGATAAIDRYVLPAGPTAANLQQRVCCCRGPLWAHEGTERRTGGRTDRPTDTVPFYRHCCAYYAGGANQLIQYAEQGLWNGTVSVCLSVRLSVMSDNCYQWWQCRQAVPDFPAVDKTPAPNPAHQCPELERTTNLQPTTKQPHHVGLSVCPSVRLSVCLSVDHKPKRLVTLLNL